jgi:hypothetical protein
MPNGEEVIVYFESVAQAIMAEQVLVERKFDVRVMPTPASIKAGCGFCLRFLPEDFENAVAFLLERGIIIKEAYLRDALDGSYRKIPLNGGTDAIRR